MPHQYLYFAHIVAGFEKMRRKAMSQRMNTFSFGDAGLALGFGIYFLNRGYTDGDLPVS